LSGIKFAHDGRLLRLARLRRKHPVGWVEYIRSIEEVLSVVVVLVGRGEESRSEKEKKLKAKLNGRRSLPFRAPALFVRCSSHHPSRARRFCLLHLSSGQQNYCLKATSNLS